MNEIRVDLDGLIKRAIDIIEDRKVVEGETKMNLELVKIINMAKTNAVEVAFWIKSKKYVKKLSIDTIETIMSDIQNPKVQFITFADSEEFKTINKADIVDITIDKKDYLIFKNAARAQEKEAKKGESDERTREDV